MGKLLLVALLLAGCVQMPEGREVDATKALDCILRAIKWVFVEPPKVFMVRPEERCWDMYVKGTANRIRGFWSDGNEECVYGSYYRNEIYLVEPVSPDIGFDETSIVHETLHKLGFEHPFHGNWHEGDYEYRLIQVGNAALRSEPQSNRIPQ